MTFSDFKQHFVDEKVELFNYLKTQIYPDSNQTYVHVLNRNNSIEKNTRKAGNGAHFRVSRWMSEGIRGECETYVYITRATSFDKETDEYCFDISIHAFHHLDYNCKIVFETDECFTKPVTKQWLERNKVTSYRNRQRLTRVSVAQSKLEFVKKESSHLFSDEDYDKFKPEYLCNYTFNHANHCTDLRVDVYKGNTVIANLGFKSIDAFFETQLKSRGAKLSTVRTIIRQKKNILLDGLLFVFDETWEAKEYKIRGRIVDDHNAEEVVSDLEGSWVRFESVAYNEESSLGFQPINTSCEWLKEMKAAEEIDEFGDPVVKYIQKSQVEHETDYWNTGLD